MKKIEFLKQGLENFCNHREPIEIDFTKGSITMITGPNGIGKTSIFQAIPFTLYGQCEKGRGDDVLNNKAKKNCHTWTIFKIDDVEYRVDRYVKYTRIGNSVTITKGDSNKPYLKGHKEVLPEIEKLLMPYKLFINTLLFSQKVKTFFTDLTDSEQKEIFRKIMTLDDYVLFGQQCGIELKEIESSVLELNQNIAVNEGIIESTTKQLEMLNNKKISFENENQTKLNELKVKIKSLDIDILNHVEKQKEIPEGIIERIQEVSNEIHTLEYSLNNIDSETSSKISTMEQQGALKISELEKTNLEMTNKNSVEMGEVLREFKKQFDEGCLKIQNQLNLINDEKQTISNEMTKVNTEVNFIKKEIDDLNLDSGLGTCPTCKREITKECIEDLESMKVDKVLIISNLEDQRIELNIRYNALTEKETNLNQIWQKEEVVYKESCKEHQDKNRAFIKQLLERKTIAINKVNSLIKENINQINESCKLEREKFNLDISELNKQLESLNEVKTEIDLQSKILSELQKNKDTYSEQIKLVSELKWDNTLIEDCESKLETCMTNINTTIANRQKFGDRVKMLEFWKVGFSASGIQSMLIDEAIPFMNKRIGHYMELLCGGRYTVTFDTLKATKGNKEFRDKISVEVFDTQTHSDKRIKFSGGQTRLVDIGTILTLADLQANIQDVSVNIILFDEIFDALDEENIRYASNLLRQASKDKWVGIISHRHIDSIEADNVLSFR